MSHHPLCAGATRVLRRGATRAWRRIRTGTTIGSFVMLALAACLMWLPAEGNPPPRGRTPLPAPALVVLAAEEPGTQRRDTTYEALRRLFPADWRSQRNPAERDSGSR